MIRLVRPLIRFSANIPLAMRAVLGIVLTLMLAWCYRRYSLTFTPNSDFANSLLEGDAIFRGNPLLKHWVLTTVSYYTTDAIPYAFGVAVRGCDPILMHEVPVTMYLLMILAAMLVAINPRTKQGTRNGWGAVIVFALIGLPADPSAFNYLLGPARVSTIFYMLLMYLALDSPEEHALSARRLFAFGTVLTIALVGDDFPKYVIVAPILLITILRIWRNRSAWKSEGLIAGTAVGAVVVAKLILIALLGAGGFVVPQTYSDLLRIIALEHLGRNIGLTIESFQSLYLCDFWGEPIRAGLLWRFLRLLSPALLLFGMYYVAMQLKKSVEKTSGVTISVDRISSYLAVGMIINVFAYCFTSLTIGLETMRYLIPFCVMGAVLVGRGVSRKVITERKTRRVIVVASLACILLAIPSFVLSVIRPLNDPPARRIGEWLKTQNLHDGYGAYWCSAEVTARASNQVRVRPIIQSENKLQPYLWGVDSLWYSPTTPSYFVLIDARGFNGKPGSFDVVVAQFGKPNRWVTRDGYTVLIYNRDISGLLANKPVINE